MIAYGTLLASKLVHVCPHNVTIDLYAVIKLNTIVLLYHALYCPCTGTSLACDMASVQVRLLHLKQQYRRLLAQKKQLCEDRDRGTASKTEQSQ